MELKNFYMNYLGIEKENKDIYICNLRNSPQNKNYYYRAIITEFDGKIIASVSKKVYELVKLCMADYTSLEQVEKKLNIQTEEFNVSSMYRMFLDNDYNEKNESKLDVSIRYLADYKKFIALKDDELIGYSKISDVYFGCGNIVVWVAEKYRKKGIATLLVNKTIQQCIMDGIVPMYLVKSTNSASITLAQKLGFKIWQKEIVLCKIQSISKSRSEGILDC